MGSRHWRRIGFGAILVLMLAALLALPAQAQGTVRITNLSVSLWPEYDQEGVLVIYRGVLADDAQLPATLRFVIPKSAGGPSSTAGVDANREYHYRSYNVEDLGDALAVTYTNPYREFQMEYYYNPLTVADTQRSFDYAFTADYAIDSLMVEVKEPAGSEQMQLTPVATETASDFDGLTLQRYSLGAFEAGQTFDVKGTYAKTDPRLSSEILNLEGPGTTQFEDVGGAKDNTLAYVLLGAAVVLLIGAAIYAVTQSQKKRKPVRVAAGRGNAKPPKAQKSRSRMTSASAVAYCHNCGNQLRPGDAFCARCGAKVKQR